MLAELIFMLAAAVEVLVRRGQEVTEAVDRLQATRLLRLLEQQTLAAAAAADLAVSRQKREVLASSLFDTQTHLPKPQQQLDLHLLLPLVDIFITLGPATVQSRSEAQHGSFCKT